MIIHMLFNEILRKAEFVYPLSTHASNHYKKSYHRCIKFSHYFSFSPATQFGENLNNIAFANQQQQLLEQFLKYFHIFTWHYLSKIIKTHNISFGATLILSKASFSSEFFKSHA